MKVGGRGRGRRGRGRGRAEGGRERKRTRAGRRREGGTPRAYNVTFSGQPASNVEIGPHSSVIKSFSSLGSELLLSARRTVIITDARFRLMARHPRSFLLVADLTSQLYLASLPLVCSQAADPWWRPTDWSIPLPYPLADPEAGMGYGVECSRTAGGGVIYAEGFFPQQSPSEGRCS